MRVAVPYCKSAGPHNAAIRAELPKIISSLFFVKSPRFLKYMVETLEGEAQGEQA